MNKKNTLLGCNESVALNITPVSRMKVIIDLIMVYDEDDMLL